MSADPGAALERRPPANHSSPWLVLALVLCAEVMDLLDSSIVNVAAPSITRDLGSSTTALQWITGGYSLTFAALLIPGARLGDRYGRRTLFLLGAWSFVACSTLCAVAPDTAALVVGRLLQGASAALLIPQGLGLLQAAFTPEEQGKAFSIFAPVVGLAAVVGPVLGGVLVDVDVFGWGWRLVFLINLPIGAAAALGSARALPRPALDRTTRLDGVGAVLAAAAATLLVYPLVQGRAAGWSAWTFAMTVGGVVALALLAGWTRRRLRSGRDPLIVPSIFRRRGFSAGVAVTLVFFTGTFGIGLALTLFLQLGRGFSAIHAGLTATPFAVGSTLGALVGAAALTPRLGRGVLQLGNLLQAVGLVVALIVLSSQQLHVTSWDLAAPLLVWGLGIGLVIAPLFDIVLASLTPDEVGSGSGVLNALQQLGAAVGVAVLGTVFFAATAHPGAGRLAGPSGDVTGLERSLAVGIGIDVATALLVLLLPRRPREPAPELPEAPPDTARVSTASG